MFIYMLAAWIGGLLTGFTLWNYGVLIALAAAPIGGSALAACVAALIYAVRTPRTPTQATTRLPHGLSHVRR